jgi:FSR family fosmidomycin resistance protein-like MFS transporter
MDLSPSKMKEDASGGDRGPAPPAGAPRFHAGGVLTLSVCHFIHDAYSSFLSPLLPLLIEKLSLSLTRAGFLSTVLQLPSLLSPYIGTLADRISVRWFIILAPMTTAIPMSLLGMAPGYGMLMLLLFLAGASVAFFHVPAPVMVSRLAGPHKGRGMSFFMAGGELARTLGPLAAVGGVALFGLEGFYPLMTLGIGASLWLYLRFRDIPVRIDCPQPVSMGSSWREMRHILLPLTAILVLRGFMHASLTAFLPTFISGETGDLWLAGTALTIYEAAGVLGVLAAGSISDRFGRRRVLMISLLAAPLGLLAFASLDGWLRFTALALVGATLLSTTPVMLALVQDQARSSPSAANGFFMMISFTARSAVVVIVGFAADQIGLRATYMLAAAIGAAAVPFVWRLPRRASASSV